MEMGNIMSTNATIDISMKMIPFKPDPTLDIWKEGRTFKKKRFWHRLRPGKKSASIFARKKERNG